MTDDNIIHLDLPKKLPPAVMEAANVLNQWAAQNGARYWEAGACASRLFAVVVRAFAPKLLVFPEKPGAADNVLAHNTAVRQLFKASRGRTDGEFFAALKEAMGAPAKTE